MKILPISLMVALVLFFIGFIHYSYKRDLNKRERELKVWIDTCIKSEGKIETVGTWYTNTHLVCYPKK